MTKDIEAEKSIATEEDAQKNNSRELDAGEVVEYLKRTPDFFEQHAELLTDITLKHSSGGAISLIERQVAVLREKNQSLESNILQLVQIAQDNEVLQEQLHRIAQRMIETDNNNNIFAVVSDLLSNEFPVLEVSLRLTAIDDEWTLPLEQSVTEEELEQPVFHSIFMNNERECQFLMDEELNTFFPEQLQVRSGVAIPLRANQNFGVLLLASTNEERFREGMGTLFLDNLADLLGRKFKKMLKD